MIIKTSDGSYVKHDGSEIKFFGMRYQIWGNRWNRNTQRWGNRVMLFICNSYDIVNESDLPGPLKEIKCD